MCQNSILESGLWQSRVQVFFCLILLSSSCCCCCFWIIYYSWVFHNISTRTRPFVTSFCWVQCIAFLCVCFCVESMKECDVTATAHNALCTQLLPFLLPSSSRKWKNINCVWSTNQTKDLANMERVDWKLCQNISNPNTNLF